MARALYFFVAFLLVSCSSNKYILFKNIGAINKPINCIVVAREKPNKQVCEPQVEYLANKGEFKLLENYVLSNDTKLSSENNSHSFGSFQVQLGDKKYTIDGRQNTIDYFTKLANILNSNQNHRLAEIFEKNILVRLRGSE